MKTTTNVYYVAIYDSGREIDIHPEDRETFATEAEAEAAIDTKLDDVCPRGSAARQFYRGEVRKIADA